MKYPVQGKAVKSSVTLSCLRAVPEFVAPAPAGRPGQGSAYGAGGLRAVAAGVVVGGRYGMRELNDRRDGFATPGQGCSATGPVIGGGAPVENPRTSWYTTVVLTPPATRARNQDHGRAEPDR
jgi:hypothetical protein